MNSRESSRRGRECVHCPGGGDGTRISIRAVGPGTPALSSTRTVSRVVPVNAASCATLAQNCVTVPLPRNAKLPFAFLEHASVGATIAGWKRQANSLRAAVMLSPPEKSGGSTAGIPP